MSSTKPIRELDFFNDSGQITIIPKPELRGFWGDSLTKPPLFSRTLFPHDLWVTAAADDRESQKEVPINDRLSTTADHCYDENGISVS